MPQRAPPTHVTDALWPLPPPFPWADGQQPANTSARTRSRWKVRRATEVMTNVMCVALSHLALRTRVCPVRGRAGTALNPHQQRVAEHLKSLASQLASPQHFASGRAALKGCLLDQAVAELLTAKVGDEVTQSLSAAPPLVAERVSYLRKGEEGRFDFDPCEHLSVFHAATYLEPRLLELPTPPQAPPGLPAVPPTQYSSSAEIVALARRWDDFGKLHLASPDECPNNQRHRLLPTPKDLEEDRLVHDRRWRNRYEHHLRGAARRLPSGADFVDFCLGPQEVAHLDSDDLKHCYPSFRASRQRALTNAVVGNYPGHLFAGTRAAKSSGSLLSGRVAVCHQGLLPGDANAVDWCQEAHEHLLYEAGALTPEAQVQNRHPFPRGPIAQALCIDDFMTMSRQSQFARRPLLAVSTAYRKSNALYVRDGLVVSRKKARRWCVTGVGLGAECLGKDGYVGSERGRRQHLSNVSLRIAAAGICTPLLLQRVASSWNYSLLYRRPLGSLLWQVYREIADNAQYPYRVFVLSARACSELTLLATLSPTMTTNIRAQFSEHLVCSDASDTMTAHCTGHVGERVHQELWRHRDRKGAYSALQGRLASFLNTFGYNDESDAVREAAAQNTTTIERVLIETFDFLEICCGSLTSASSLSPLSDAVAAQGLRVGPMIDISLHPLWDLRSLRIIEWLIFLTSRGRVWHVHTASTCRTFSVAYQPRIRSRDAPRGFNPKDAKTHQGNLLKLRCLAVQFSQWANSPYHGSDEHPRSAYSWFLDAVVWLFGQEGNVLVDGSSCMYGAPYQKDYRLGLVRSQHLVGPMGLKCPGISATHQHSAPLRGGTDASRAARYVSGFCGTFAAALRVQFDLEAPVLGNADAKLSQSAQQVRLEKIWMLQLLRSLRWSSGPSCVRKVSKDVHINLKEIQAHCDSIGPQSASPSHRQIYIYIGLHGCFRCFGQGEVAIQID